MAYGFGQIILLLAQSKSYGLWSNSGFKVISLPGYHLHRHHHFDDHFLSLAKIESFQYSSFDIFGLWLWPNYSTIGFGQISAFSCGKNYSTFCHSQFSNLFHCSRPLALPPSMMVQHYDNISLSLDKIEHFSIQPLALAKLFGLW